MIVTGAKVEEKAEVSEAVRMKRLAEGEGVQGDSIVLEEKALNTIENAYYTKNLLLDTLCPSSVKKRKGNENGKGKKKDKKEKEEEKRKKKEEAAKRKAEKQAEKKKRKEPKKNKKKTGKEEEAEESGGEEKNTNGEEKEREGEREEETTKEKAKVFVVTSDYHGERSRKIFEHVLGDCLHLMQLEFQNSVCENLADDDLAREMRVEGFMIPRLPQDLAMAEKWWTVTFGDDYSHLLQN